MKHDNNFCLKSGFTLAETLVVLTVLGIIATIMLTAIKPGETKEKALAVQAQKMLVELDNATKMILLYDSPNHTMKRLTPVDGSREIGGAIGMSSVYTAPRITDLYKKYLSSARKPCNDDTCICYTFNNHSDKCGHFYLKNGACVVTCLFYDYYSHAKGHYIYPGENQSIANNYRINCAALGAVVFDVNGNDGPNAKGKDIFIIPLGDHGIITDPEDFQGVQCPEQTE